MKCNEQHKWCRCLYTYTHIYIFIYIYTHKSVSLYLKRKQSVVNFGEIFSLERDFFFFSILSAFNLIDFNLFQW